ncbi:hypothetical protein [Acidiphilium sp.]|uniref:hypothetical protein n=1 Tax=Acidiphilium sp. TaxID=527 RepID=UPI0025866B9F|nr:hypothetical protein [Acidiphilium sp.]
MKLPELIEYMTRRFPPSSEIIDIQVSFIVERDSGIVETIEMSGEDDDGDDPDGGEQCHPAIADPRRKALRVV